MVLGTGTWYLYNQGIYMVLGTGPLHGIWYLVLGTMAYGHLVLGKKYNQGTMGHPCPTLYAVVWLVWRQDRFKLKKYMVINLGNVWQFKQICPTAAAA